MKHPNFWRRKSKIKHFTNNLHFFFELMKFKQFLIFSVILLMLGGLWSCKSSRRFAVPLKEEGPDYLIAKMKEKEFVFHTIEAKFTIEYKQGRKNHDFKGQIRMVKDSLIWINFNQDLGIEIARVMITQDSVKFLDRLQKEYLITDYKYINGFLKSNLDFGILQSIILGNDFEYYENAKFKATVDGGQYKLSTSERRKLKKFVRNSEDEERIFLQHTWLNPENFKINQIKLKELSNESKKLSAEYSNFELVGEQLFPFSATYLIEAEEAIHLKIKYTRITLDKNLNFPFKIPSKYSSAK